MIQHRPVINRLVWMQSAYPIGSEDTILQKTAITFDVSVWELFWWTLAGPQVCLLPHGGEKNPELIISAIQEQGITTMHFVPAMLHAFLEYAEGQQEDELQHQLRTLRQVFASGEALLSSHAARFHRLIAAVNGAQLINLYGPTEATVDVSHFPCAADQGDERYRSASRSRIRSCISWRRDRCISSRSECRVSCASRGVWTGRGVTSCIVLNLMALEVRR